MKNISLALAKRFEEVIINGDWVANTNLVDQIKDVQWEEAILKPHGFNSIAMLTYHLHYYIKGLVQAFETGKLTIHDAKSFDVPAIQNQNDWNRIKDDVIHDAQKFSELVESMNNEILFGSFIDPKYGTMLRNIDCMIEHSYYHLGQMVLIKKMLREKNIKS